VLTAAAAALTSGCIFDPPRGGSVVIPAAVYLVPSDPGRVLINLSTAYEHKDSVETKLIYDVNYTGTSEDLNDPSVTLPFTYHDEVDHVAALARNPNISSAYLNLGSVTSWNRLGSDDPSHPDWAVIQISGSQIDVEVTEGNTLYLAKGGTEFFEFKFQPTTPAPSSPSDTLWKIIRWRETK